MRNIELRENTVMLDFFCRCGSLRRRCCNKILDGAVRAIGAGAVVLACGGIGGLYKNSTNYPHHRRCHCHGAAPWRGLPPS